MKENYAIILVAIIGLTQQNAKAQMYMGIYGTHTHSINSLASPDAGGGFAMSFLSKGDSLGDKKSSSHIVLQLGANYYYSGLGRRTFYDVPLLAPQAGDSRVTLSNSMFGLNALARFSLPNHSVFTPYADVFAGYRATYSNLVVSPYLQYASQTQSTQSLASISGLNYGFGAGILTSLSKKVKFDVGISYAEAVQTGQIADLNSAYADASGINLNLKSVPTSLLTINVGLLFYLDGSNVSYSRGCNCNQSYYYPTYYPPTNGGVGHWGGGGAYYPPSNWGGGSGSHWSGGSSGSWGSSSHGASVGVHVGGGGGHVGGHFK